MSAEKMQSRAAVNWLQPVFAAQHIKERSTDADVFVERGARNALGFGVDGECQPLVRLPYINGLDEEHAAGKGCVAHSAGALLRIASEPLRLTGADECCLDGRGKAQSSGPGIGCEFFRTNGGHTFDV